TYQGVRVRGADVYGGASANSPENYAVVGLGENSSLTRSYSVTFSDTGASGLNYFGFWLSALDGGNQLTFFNGANEVGFFDSASVISHLNAATGSNYSDYMGNPFGGGNSGEPYAFLNFYLEEGTFDRVVFAQKPGT